MPNDVMQIRSRGLAGLAAIVSADAAVAGWSDRLSRFAFTTREHDPFVWLTCVLALRSVSEGNFGVGAVIAKDGAILADGRNQAFYPTFQTGRHAEAVALDRFEDAFPQAGAAIGAVLFSSLECCPMCTVRLVNCGIRTVYYATADPDCGMIGRWSDLPEGYRRLSAGRVPPQTFGAADCTQDLVDAAAAIFALNADALAAIMAAR